MTNTKYAIRVGKSIKFICQMDIMYCISDANYTDITVINGKKMLTSKSLKDLEQIFDPGLFIRVHNSWIVNISYVISFYQDNSNYIVMKDGKVLQISRRKKKDFMMMFQKL